MFNHVQSEEFRDAVVERARRGDANAFYELVKPCERSVYTAALSILGNSADAEQTAQEAVLKAFKNISCFRGQAKFRSPSTRRR